MTEEELMETSGQKLEAYKETIEARPHGMAIFAAARLVCAVNNLANVTGQREVARALTNEVILLYIKATPGMTEETRSAEIREVIHWLDAFQRKV